MMGHNVSAGEQDLTYQEANIASSAYALEKYGIGYTPKQLQEATAKIFALSEQNYMQVRSEIQNMIVNKKNKNIDPNIKEETNAGFQISPFCQAIWRNDEEMVRLYLQAGANPNRQGDCSPLLMARSVKIGQLLVDGGAGVDYQMLGRSLYNGASAEMVALLSHTEHLASLRFPSGIDPFGELYANIKHQNDVIEKTAILAWYSQRGTFCPSQLPAYPCQKKFPQQACQVKTLMKVLPHAQKKAAEEQSKVLKGLVADHILPDPAGLVIGYAIAPEDIIPWDKKCWLLIDASMKRLEAAEKTDTCSSCSVS